MSRVDTGYEVVPSTKLPTHLDAVVHFVRGVIARRSAVFKGLMQMANEAERLEEQFRQHGREKLAEILTECSCQARCETVPDKAVRPLGVVHPAWLPVALAALRELSDRVTGLRPFPVQLAGAAALHSGYLAEMATGEGKTLVAALAAIMSGWCKRPCHVVTVNDYLAERDAQWFRALFHAAGVSTGVVSSRMNVSERRQGYAADVTYTTSKEILADFLRDRISLGSLHQRDRLLLHAEAKSIRRRSLPVVMRGLHCAIIDEADSVLIDEAVTPLIISRERPNENLREACAQAYQLSELLQPTDDYITDNRFRDIELTATGLQKLASAATCLPPLWRGESRRTELVEQALQAREFHQRDKQYVVQDGKIVIVDEFTGRLMPQRTWRDGLHQAIEAREGLSVTSPTETLARMSFQQFFRLFPKLSGMTGTAWEARRELWHIYQLPVVRIPTHRPIRRNVQTDRVFDLADEKWKAIVEEVAHLNSEGRPVLVGTRSIVESERLSAMLAVRHLPHRVLNAVRHGEEAMIVAEAGNFGSISIATNMAGRGTDIKLSERVAQLGGLAVLATERHESERIDRQLFGRSGRQGDPGSALAFVSWEDEVVTRYSPKWIRWIIKKMPKSIRLGVLRNCLAIAQRRAEGQAFEQRKGVLRADQWLAESLGFTGSQIG